MGLDIRKPIGLLLLLTGLQLAAYGAFANPEEFQRSLGLNVDLYWGIALIVFGSIFLALAQRAGRRL